MISTTEEKKIYKCACYTRKSTDENLDCEFNSLDAQRDSAENFVASQKMNGWQLLPDKYDDGGFSGSNTERPALKRLITDIESGKIDIVVIYKLDRLSRSLLDFMKLIEFLEAHNTSIVSITQQINTSTSAGRMMINILMTFAQYEREVIAERIRDKIAGAKRHGKHCGGVPVLGYDSNPETKKLSINEKEAEIVRHIFKRYSELGSAHEVASELNKQGYKSKSWITRKGESRKGVEFGGDRIYRILNNPLYIGQVVHKDKVFPGEQEAIIDKHTWELARGLLGANTQAHRRSRHALAYPLKGLIRCGYCGGGITTNYAKSKNRRYIYLRCVKNMKNTDHSCPLKQISGSDFEKAVLQQIGAIFRTPSVLAKTYDTLRKNETEKKASLLVKKDELTAKMESLRKKMIHAINTESQGELVKFKEESANAGRELEEVKKYIKIFSSSPISHTEIIEAFNNIEALWAELFPAEKYQLAKLFIEKIILRNDRMEIEIKTNCITSLVKELNSINEERK